MSQEVTDALAELVNNSENLLGTITAVKTTLDTDLATASSAAVTSTAQAGIAAREELSTANQIMLNTPPEAFTLVLERRNN